MMPGTLRETIESIALTACESGDAIWADEAQQIAEAMLTDPRIEIALAARSDAQPDGICCDVPGGLDRCLDCPLDVTREAIRSEQLSEADVVLRWLSDFADRGIVTIGGKGGALEAARMASACR